MDGGFAVCKKAVRAAGVDWSCPIIGPKTIIPEIEAVRQRRLRQKQAGHTGVAGSGGGFFSGTLLDILPYAFVDGTVLVNQIVIIFKVRIKVSELSFEQGNGKNQLTFSSVSL